MSCVSDTTSLIVGASRGLGRALLDELRRQGRKVVGVARAGQASDILLRDAAEPGIAANLLNEIKPSTLYICAAEGIYGETPTSSEIERVLRNTLHLPMQWIRAGVDLLPPEGRIAWVSSLSALVPHPHWAVYGACKAAVEHYIESIRQIAVEKDVYVTICYPGRLGTTFHERAGAPPPSGAVDPTTLAPDLIAAVDRNAPWWAAPMDLLIVRELRSNRYPDAQKQGAL